MYKSMVVWLAYGDKLAITFCRGTESSHHYLPLTADMRMAERAFRLGQAGYTCRPFLGGLGYVMEKEDSNA